MAYCPEPWREDPVPDEVKGCEICGLYRQGTRMVWGEGSANARIMVILDNPGARESRGGEPFVCGTRQTLQEAAFDAGFTQKDLYVTYLLKRRPIRAYDKPVVRSLCMQHLENQLQDMSPQIVFCLGNVVVQSFFDNPDCDVKSLRGRLHKARGFSTLVSYHPLAVRRRPNLKAHFNNDWNRLYKIYNEYI